MIIVTKSPPDNTYNRLLQTAGEFSIRKNPIHRKQQDTTMNSFRKTNKVPTNRKIEYCSLTTKNNGSKSQNKIIRGRHRET